MKIIVKAKPGSKVELVERMNHPTLDLLDFKKCMIEYKVSIKEPPVRGKANNAIVRALAKYFNVSPSLVRMVSGQSSRKKVYEIVGL
jgi:uncharacterized protein (TIGR00251 family)